MFIDLEKAYDRVSQKRVWQTLQMAETDDYLITVIKHRYPHRDSTCQLKMEIDWQSFKTNKGLF